MARKTKPLPKFWQIKAMDDGAEILIDGVIGFTDPWDDEGNTTARAFRKELKALGPVSKLTVRINSRGGLTDDGWAIYNALVEHEAEVVVIIDPLAASAAATIAMAGDRIEMQPNAQMMIHGPSGWAYGQRRDFQSALEQMERLEDSMAEVYAARLGTSKDDVLAMFAAGDKWYSAREAVEAGLADAVRGQEDGRQAATPPDENEFQRAARMAAAQTAALHCAAQAEGRAEMADTDHKAGASPARADDNQQNDRGREAPSFCAEAAVTLAHEAGVPEVAMTLIRNKLSGTAAQDEINRVKSIKQKCTAAKLSAELTQQVIDTGMDANTIGSLMTSLRADADQQVTSTAVVAATTKSEAEQRKEAAADLVARANRYN